MNSMISLARSVARPVVKYRSTLLVQVAGLLTRSISKKASLTPSKALVPPKKITSVQTTENENSLRVRRCRISDVPNLLHFVKDNAANPWPGLVTSGGIPPSSQLVLNDYTERVLAQGHSLICEEPHRANADTSSSPLGLGLVSVYSPWDSYLLDKWASCIQCSRAKRLLHFNAHCLEAPDLHKKYQLKNIMHVSLIVPSNKTKHPEIINVLALHAAHRAREIGYPIVRFDATNSTVSELLEEMNMKKEWEISYAVLPAGPDSDNQTPLSYVKTEDLIHKSITATCLTESPNLISVYTVNTSGKLNIVPKVRSVSSKISKT